MLCRHTYGMVSYEGYLNKGLPTEYGEGASEILREVAVDPAAKYQHVDEELRPGDIERVSLEWRSMLNHIARAPDYEWDRWLDFRRVVREYIETHPAPNVLSDTPDLTLEQRTRRPGPLRFR